MRIVFIALLAIPGLFMLILGLALFDYIYYPIISFKAENAAESYLEETYSSEFVIDESTYSKPLGNDWGDYHIIAHPKNHPDMEVTIAVDEEMESLYDNYLEMHWREQLNTRFGSLYKELYGFVEKHSYMVNVTFSEEIEAKHDHTDTYEEILQKESGGISNIVFANVLLASSNDMDGQLEKAYKMIQHFKEQSLKYFSIEIVFFDENLQHQLTKKDRKLTHSEFIYKYLDRRTDRFYFSYDVEVTEDRKALADIHSARDLTNYLR